MHVPASYERDFDFSFEQVCETVLRIVRIDADEIDHDGRSVSVRLKSDSMAREVLISQGLDSVTVTVEGQFGTCIRPSDRPPDPGTFARQLFAEIGKTLNASPQAEP